MLTPDGQAIYAEYLARVAWLASARAFAQAVVTATSGAGKTPVEPLATMGPGGGPLVCDACGKPMVLEGGGFQGVDADVAWARNPKMGWVSYISGGMNVLVETNGTLRIFHGYANRGTSSCASRADAIEIARRAEHRARIDRADVSARLDAVAAYLRSSGVAPDTDAHLNEVYRTLFTYDPGPGVNTP